MERSRPLTTDEAYKILFQDLMLERRTAMPGIIKKVNIVGTALQSVDVQPAISQLVANSDGISSSEQQLPIIPSVPVVLPYSAKLGLSLTIPITVGDDCLLIIGDRSIDKWQENGGVNTPVETTVPRAHELTDAICIPGCVNSTTTIANYATDAIEIRDSDRAVYFSLSSSTIKAANGTTSLELNGTTVLMSADSATLTLSATTLVSSVPIEAPSFSGASGGVANFTNDINMGSNSINDVAEITVNGIPLGAHTHNAPSGGGTTSGPQ